MEMAASSRPRRSLPCPPQPSVSSRRLRWGSSILQRQDLPQNIPENSPCGAALPQKGLPRLLGTEFESAQRRSLKSASWSVTSNSKDAEACEPSASADVNLGFELEHYASLTEWAQKHDAPWTRPWAVDHQSEPEPSERNATQRCRELQDWDKATEKKSKDHLQDKLLPSHLREVINQILPLRKPAKDADIADPDSAEPDMGNQDSLNVRKRGSKFNVMPVSGSSIAPSELESLVANRQAVAEEVVTFRVAIGRSFGSASRALRVMKRAAVVQFANAAAADEVIRRGIAAHKLSKAEFEWCVTSFLNFGDQKLAQRLFSTLDKSRTGQIGFVEITCPPEKSDKLSSLVEVGQKLQNYYGSLDRAFRQLQETLGKSGTTVRRINSFSFQEFVDGAAAMGLEPFQAAHLFSILDIDGDGKLTIHEFIERLGSPSKEAILQDLWQRLIVRYASLEDAFRNMNTSRLLCLSRPDFYTVMARVNVSEMEAVELFRLLDVHGFATVTLNELWDSISAATPPATVDSFWVRFAAEWPDIAYAARRGLQPTSFSLDLRKSLGGMLAALLPEETRKQCSQLQSAAEARRKAVVPVQTRGRRTSVRTSLKTAVTAALFSCSEAAHPSLLSETPCLQAITPDSFAFFYDRPQCLKRSTMLYPGSRISFCILVGDVH